LKSGGLTGYAHGGGVSWPNAGTLLNSKIDIPSNAEHFIAHPTQRLNPHKNTACRVIFNLPSAANDRGEGARTIATGPQAPYSTRSQVVTATMSLPSRLLLNGAVVMVSLLPAICAWYVRVVPAQDGM
jgi:hypothetical protein